MTTDTIALPVSASYDAQTMDPVLLTASAGEVVSPLPPVITNVTEDSAGLPQAVPYGGVTSDQLPVITGTAEPGTTVVIADNGVVIGQTVTDASWLWTLQPATPLAADVLHNFVATATQTDTGAATAAAVPFQLLVEPPPLAPPVITAIMVMDGGVSKQMVEGGQTMDMRPVLQGTSEPGTVVEIFDNGTRIGEAVAGTDWYWTFTPSQAVAVDAFHAFTAVASRADGSDSTSSIWAATCTVGVAPNPLLPPVISVVSQDDGDVPVDIPPNGVSEDTTPEFYGTSEPGSIVTVLDGESVVGRTIAAADWSWSLTAGVELAPGVQHQLHVAATRADGSGLTYSTADYPVWVAPQGADLPAVPVLDSAGSLDQLLATAGLPAATQTGTVAGGAMTVDTVSLATQSTALHQAAVPELAY